MEVIALLVVVGCAAVCVISSATSKQSPQDCDVGHSFPRVFVILEVEIDGGRESMSKEVLEGGRAVQDGCQLNATILCYKWWACGTSGQARLDFADFGIRSSEAPNVTKGVDLTNS